MMLKNTCAKESLETPWQNFITCVNDNKNVDIENPHIILCKFCFDNLVNATNPRTQSRKH